MHSKTQLALYSQIPIFEEVFCGKDQSCSWMITTCLSGVRQVKEESDASEKNKRLPFY